MQFIVKLRINRIPCAGSVRGFSLRIGEIRSASRVWTCGTMYYIPNLPGDASVSLFFGFTIKKSNSRSMVIAQVPAVLLCVRVLLGLTGSPLAKHIGCLMRILRPALQMRDPSGDVHGGVLSLTLPQLPEVPRD